LRDQEIQNWFIENGVPLPNREEVLSDDLMKSFISDFNSQNKLKKSDKKVKINALEGYTRIHNNKWYNMDKEKITELRTEVHVIDKHNDNKIIKRPGFLLNIKMEEFVPKHILDK